MIPLAHFCAPVDGHALARVTLEFGTFIRVGLGTDDAFTLMRVLTGCPFVVVAAYPSLVGEAGF